eukprot:1065086-Rhodomonas_salina.1
MHQGQQRLDAVQGCRPGPKARGQAFSFAHLHLCGDLCAHAAPSCAGCWPIRQRLRCQRGALSQSSTCTTAGGASGTCSR